MQSRTGAHPPAARQPWSPVLLKRGVGGCSSPRGAASPPSPAAPASPTRLAPVIFSTVQLPPKLQRDAAGPPGRQLPRFGAAPYPSGPEAADTPRDAFPHVPCGIFWHGMGMISRAREQIRDLTLPVFPKCGTHARHSHCYFNVSWMHVAALHKPFCTHAPPRPQATSPPALGVSRAKTARHRKWKSQFRWGLKRNTCLIVSCEVHNEETLIQETI